MLPRHFGAYHSKRTTRSRSPNFIYFRATPTKSNQWTQIGAFRQGYFPVTPDRACLPCATFCHGSLACPPHVGPLGCLPNTFRTLRLLSRRMHEAAGLISIEGSLEGLTKEGSLPDKRPTVSPEDAAAAKSARKKARKAARAKKANGDL